MAFVGLATGAVSARDRMPCETCIVDLPTGAAFGVFDFSLEADGKRVWASHSAVDTPVTPACAANGQVSHIAHVDTRLAYSDTHGVTWVDAGLVNPTDDVCLPEPDGVGAWVNEVSTLVRDDGAPAGERWKLFWHRYLWARDAAPSNRRFQHGWIALRAAPTPAALAAAPMRKLFVAGGYDPSNDATSGPPEVRLQSLHPDLAACIVATEPGALWLDGVLYLALTCHALDPARTRTVLLAAEGAGWRYVGTLFDAALSTAAGSAEVLTAPELFRKGRRAFVIATPSAAGVYQGCSAFRVDVDRGAVLLDRRGVARTFRRLVTTTTPFSGACGWDPLARKSGMLFGEVRLGAPPFTTLRSRVRP